MDLEIFNNIQEKSSNLEGEIQEINPCEEIELAKKLDAIEEYSVDRFEGEYAVLENRKTNEIKNVKKDLLPTNIKEGTILQYVNGKYLCNEEVSKEEINRIQEKMNKLWN